MDKKKIILIGILLVIIVGIILIIITSQNYEKIEITPNGTSIEVPSPQTKYKGEFEGVKIWNWDKGLLVTYNSHADNRNIKLGGMSFNVMKDIITAGNIENHDGFSFYVINADDLFEIQLFDFIKVNYKGKFYCIPLTNETTGDNIIICCNDKDIALHMAQSVLYKNVYPDTSSNNIVNNTIKNISEELISKSPIDSNDVANTIEKGKNLLSKSQIKV